MPLDKPEFNHLLAALPDVVMVRWKPYLQVVTFELGQVLYESVTTLDYVYFPTTTIVSLLDVIEDGDSAEIAVVGNEGLVGISIFMGGDSTPSRAVLLRLDRMTSNEVVMTQELIAKMLGVRREGVTEAALNLQRAGLIQYARGHIAVLDRPGLDKRTCECYTVVKKEYDRLLPALKAT